jgi:hypothetical protein
MKLLMILSLVVVSFASISANAGFISATTNNNEVKPETPTPQTRQGPPIMHLPSIIDCSAPQNIQEIVQGQFGEIPFVNGGTVIKRPDGVIMPALMTLYVNMETGTYSLIAKFPEVSLWCIINSGGNFKPAVREKAT